MFIRLPRTVYSMVMTAAREGNVMQNLNSNKVRSMQLEIEHPISRR